MVRGEDLNGIEHVHERFERLRARKEAALIPYFVAGYPSLRDTREHLWTAYEAGASLVELGIPFSDPVADGPTIQKAIQHALGKGVTPQRCLDLVASMRKEGFDLPVLGMTYANVLFNRGFDRSAKQWAAAGVDGAIIPDISVGDAGPFRQAWSHAGLGTVFFVSPSTPASRIGAALEASSAFLYLVAVYGTTGARRDVASTTVELVRRTRRARRGRNEPPVCVGFGISEPKHVKALTEAGAEGVIVGSAVLDVIDSGRPLRRYLKDLKRATRLDGHEG